MLASQDHIDGLVAPRESLAAELKDRFDPRLSRGRADLLFEEGVGQMRGAGGEGKQPIACGGGDNAEDVDTVVVQTQLHESSEKPVGYRIQLHEAGFEQLRGGFRCMEMVWHVGFHR